MNQSPGGDLGAKKKKKKQKRKKEKPGSGGAKSDSASDSQEIKVLGTPCIFTGSHEGDVALRWLAVGLGAGRERFLVRRLASFERLRFVSLLDQNPAIPMQKLQDIQRAMELLSTCQGPAKNIDEATKHKYQFWDTQPVPKLSERPHPAPPGGPRKRVSRRSAHDEVVTTHGPIEPDKENIRQEPYSLPQGFMWDTLDLSNAEVLKELYTLLNENYVEDDDNMFRFDYSPNFLKWALRPPGWLPHWHCGVRVSSNKKLVCFISAIPANIHIYDTSKKMVEINFLCVHKKLRAKRVAPVLIREITRRVNLEGTFQAVYTAGVVLPKPVATCRYWHRSLNPRKLVEVKFSHLSRNMTLQRTMKLYRLPDTTKAPGLRPMEKKDVKQVTALLEKYLKQFHLAPIMGEEEVSHWFLPQENIIDTYVVEGDSGRRRSIPAASDRRFKNSMISGKRDESRCAIDSLVPFQGPGGVLTDFTSFYTLPSTVMHHPVHKSLKAAYSFYTVHTETPLMDLMNDALILARQKGFDVFNALDLMENKTFLEKLKFGIGDGNLQYYLYNWKCPPMEPEKEQEKGVSEKKIITLNWVMKRMDIGMLVAVYQDFYAGSNVNILLERMFDLDLRQNPRHIEAGNPGGDGPNCCRKDNGVPLDAQRQDTAEPQWPGQALAEPGYLAGGHSTTGAEREQKVEDKLHVLSAQRTPLQRIFLVSTLRSPTWQINNLDQE
ncbi:glycylpeptide N-tetradecanoyltransferase 2-like, partial [Scleropages formosus]